MQHKRSPLTDVQQIDVLLTEYGVLYSLLEWRLSAGDRRLFVSAGLVTGLLTAVHVLDDATARLLLWGLPVLLWVIFSAMVGHTRSKEDLLRRIDEIERRVNALADSQLLIFQSHRPNPRPAVGGRTGSTGIKAMLAVNTSLLLAAVLFLWPASAPLSLLLVCYGLWAAMWAGLMLRQAWTLQNYRYERPAITSFSCYIIC